MDHSVPRFKGTGVDVQIHSTAIIKHPDMVTIGSHVAIDIGVYIATPVDIGDWIHIAPYVCIIGGDMAYLEMENFTGISAGAKIICAGDDFTKGFLSPFIPIKYRHVINKPIHFKKYSGVGTNCIVMPGVTLAEGSVVGAGSVLTKDTEPWGVYIGSPAVRNGTRDKELILKGASELGYDV